MRVILTGLSDSGKSTVCRRVVERAGEAGMRVGGVLTEKTISGKERTLHVRDLNDNTVILLARTNWTQTGPQHGAFTFSNEGIFLGIKAIGRGVSFDLLIVDEIGPLELKGRGFYPILHLIRKARQCIVVIRPQIVEFFREKLQLDESFRVIEVTAENRDELVDQLFAGFLADHEAEPA